MPWDLPSRGKKKKQQKEEEEERQRQQDLEERMRIQRQRQEDDEEAWKLAQQNQHSGNSNPTSRSGPGTSGGTGRTGNNLLEFTPAPSHLDELAGALNAHGQTTLPPNHASPGSRSQSPAPNPRPSNPFDDNQSRAISTAQTNTGASTEDFTPSHSLVNGDAEDAVPLPLMDRLRYGVSQKLRIHMPHLLVDPNTRGSKKASTPNYSVVDEICRVVAEQVRSVNMEESTKLSFQNKLLNKDLKAAQDEVSIRMTSIEDMRHKIASLEKQVSVADQKLADQRTKHETDRLRLQIQNPPGMDAKLADLNRQIREKDEHIRVRDLAITANEETITERETKILNLTQQFEADGFHLERIRGERQKLREQVDGFERQVKQHSRQMDDLVNEHRINLAEQKEDLRAQLKTKVKEEFEELQRSLRWTTGELERAQTANEALANTHRKEKEHLEEIHNAQVRSLSDEHAEKTATLTDDHATFIATLRSEHDSAVQSLKEQDKAKRAQLTLEHEQIEKENFQLHKKEEEKLLNKIDRLKQDAATEKTRLEGIIQSQKTEMEASHAAKVEELNERYDILEEQKTNLEQRHREEVAETDRKHKEFVSGLKKKHQADLLSREQRLRADVNDLSQALMTRDNYVLPTLMVEDVKQSNDEYLKSRFQELIQFVDDMGRLEWKSNQQVWPDRALHALEGPNHTDRLLKKQILQDDIWNLLHEFVFCSPFRVFGEEGENLEKEWNEQCGKDPNFNNGLYTWPELGAETERWRYATVGECRAALTKPVPSKWDPRAKLKQAFRAHLEDMRDEFTTRIGGLIEWDENNKKAMERLTLKAMNTWLDFAMQRCRVVVTLEGDKVLSPAEKARNALQQGSLHIDVVPSLGRYGNSEGADLDAFDIIGGCDGLDIKLPS